MCMHGLIQRRAFYTLVLSYYSTVIHHWSCSPLSFRRGVRDVSHLSLSWHYPPEGDEALLPPVWDLWLTLLCTEYQVWFPGRHKQSSAKEKTINILIVLMIVIPALSSLLLFLNGCYSWPYNYVLVQLASCKLGIVYTCTTMYIQAKILYIFTITILCTVARYSIYTWYIIR